MHVEFPLIVFRKLLKIMEGWGDTLLFGFQPDGVEIQANKHFVSMIFVRLDMELVVSFDSPPETIARCVKTRVLQQLIDFVGDNATISLGCDHEKDNSPFYIIINNKSPRDRDIRVSVQQPETTLDLFLIPDKQKVASRCYILTDEIQRITELFSMVCNYFTFSFKSKAIYLVSKSSRDMIDNVSDEHLEIFEEIGIEIELPISHNPKPKLSCDSGKITGKKLEKPKKVMNVLINKEAHAIMDLRHFRDIMNCVVSDPPKYMLCQLLQDKKAPFEVKYLVSNLGYVKIYMALLLDHTK